MNKLMLAALIGFSVSLPVVKANAQVAGTTTLAVTVTDVDQIARGWSAKKNVLGKLVYNEGGEKVGKIEDLIVDIEKNVSYVIVGAGGFVGIGRHDVAIPVSAIRQESGKFILAGATKESVKAMPGFNYSADTAKRDKLVRDAERDVSRAKEKVAELQKKADNAAADGKTKMDAEIVIIKQDQKSVEDSLARMKVAGVARWKEFEGDIGNATARLRKSVDKASV